MPQIVVEVLVLELRVPADLSYRDAARAGTGGPGGASGFFCEVAPAWDHFWSGQGGDYYRTSSAEPDDEGRMVWFGDPAATHFLEWSKVEVAEKLEPLVAFLVDVPPPGGVHNLGRQKLGVAIKATGPAASLTPGHDVEVPLRPLIYAQPGQPVHLYVQAANGLSSVGMLATWLPAPSGLQQLLRPPPEDSVKQASTRSAASHASDALGRGKGEDSWSTYCRPRSGRGKSPARGSPGQEPREPQEPHSGRPRPWSPKGPRSPMAGYPVAASYVREEWPLPVWMAGKVRGVNVLADADALIECCSARAEELAAASETLGQAIQGFQRLSAREARRHRDQAEPGWQAEVSTGWQAEAECSEDELVRNLRERHLYEPVLKSATLRQRTAARGGAVQAARTLRTPRR